MIIPECDLSTPMTTRRNILIFFVCLLILGVGGFIALRFMQTRPTPAQRPPAKLSPLVEAMRVEAGPRTVTVRALGSVTAARQTSIRPEVQGVVREVGEGFLPGGVVQAGKTLLRLDGEDFALAVASREAELEKAKADLDLELGYQEVARHEWDLVRRGGTALENADLALRKPQLAQARAKVRQAEAALAQARLDLKRTTIAAPFTALVLDKQAEIGTRVTTQDVVAELVDAKEYWVQGSLPVDRLDWVFFPDKGGRGSKVVIASQASGARREGRLLKLRADLESEGRMARFLATLPDPLKGGETPIMLGEYVRLDIEGRTLDNVVALPRAALREGDTVWVVNNAALDIRPVEVAWRDTETVLVSSGLSDGDLVVTSELAAPVQGMSVTLASEAGK
jgi:RND family efflux transporter MFP subunit